MNDQFTLPDGSVIGTGLKMPPFKASALPVYESVGPMLTMDEIIAVAKQRPKWGRGLFDSSFIKNQKSHGSCNGFAGAAALTRARIRRGLERVDLSGAFLYSLINGGSDDGSMLEDGMKTIQDHGVATEATVGWDAIYPNRYDRVKADTEAARFRAFECYAVGTERGLFSALASGFDCVVAVHVSGDQFMTLDSKGVPGGGNGPGNHAVGADDLWWDNELIAAGYNSWDTSYGHNGQMGLTWNRFFQYTTGFHMFFACRSTMDDPSGNNPPPAN